MNQYNIKMFYTGETTASHKSVSITMQYFRPGRGAYRNPADEIGLMKQQLKELEELTIQLREIDMQLQNLETALSVLL
jgi:hypothetical protein